MDRLRLITFIIQLNGTIFYIHTPKCGGTSVGLALDDPRILRVKTSDIIISDEIFDFLFRKRTGKSLIIHGHIHYLGSNQNEVNPSLHQKFIRTLYKEIPLIFPTRHPADLVQSWMHYSKTRANKLISDMVLDGASTIETSGKIAGMFSRIACLKQNDLELNDGKIKINNHKINLALEDEELNMHLFINYLLGNKKNFPLLRSMQMQLMYPIARTIKKKVFEGMPYTIIPPFSDEKRSVFYYDSQNISDGVANRLDHDIFYGFSDKLRAKRANSSINKTPLLASSIKSVDERLRSVIPNEYRIYGMNCTA